MEYPKKPGDCENIGEVRNALDQIDMEIIQLFALRNKYVREIVKFKSGDEGIRARERREVVLEQRKAWAKERDLDPEMMEEIFKILIEKNIQIQFDIYKKEDR
jgi:isochorismate pyruvate lyase